MPAILPRPGRPSLYPDWSTLVHAFDGMSLDAPAPKRNLATVVHRVSQKANLCLSFTHLLELLRAQDAAQRRARAAWLDGMEVVWLRDLDAVQVLEIEQVLRRAAQLPVAPTELPAAASFLSSFQLIPHQVPELLRCGTVLAFVEAAAENPRIRTQLNAFASQGPAFAQLMFADRKRAKADDLSPAGLESFLRAKVDTALTQQALAIGKRLAEEGKLFLQNGLLYVPPDEAFVRRAMRPLEELRQELPLPFVFYKVNRAAAAVAGDASSADATFLRSEDRKGDPFDWLHLVGAAYCDVFVCDRFTSHCLGTAREHIGRTPQLVCRDLTGFADQLQARLQL